MANVDADVACFDWLMNVGVDLISGAHYENPKWLSGLRRNIIRRRWRPSAVDSFALLRLISLMFFLAHVIISFLNFFF